MKNRITSAALQYSKWLSRFICWIWAIHRTLIYIAAVIQPTSAEALASTISGLDTIMLVNEGTYLVNSLGEKWIYSDKFVISWIKRCGFSSIMSKLSKPSDQKEDNSNDDDIKEEGDNG